MNANCLVTCSTNYFSVWGDFFFSLFCGLRGTCTPSYCFLSWCCFTSLSMSSLELAIILHLEIYFYSIPCFHVQTQRAQPILWPWLQREQHVKCVWPGGREIVSESRYHVSFQPTLHCLFGCQEFPASQISALDYPSGLNL